MLHKIINTVLVWATMEEQGKYFKGTLIHVHDAGSPEVNGVYKMLKGDDKFDGVGMYRTLQSGKARIAYSAFFVPAMQVPSNGTSRLFLLIKSLVRTNVLAFIGRTGIRITCTHQCLDGVNVMDKHFE